MSEEHSAAYNGAEGAATAESWLGRAAHLAEAGVLGEGAAGVAEALPGIGQIAAGVSGAVNAGMAVSDFANEGIHSDEGWNHVGGGILGAAGAATAALGPYAPVAGAALAAGEIGVDAVGAGAGALFGDEAGFTADSVVGGLARGTFGDNSIGYGLGSGLSDMLGGGTAADIAGGVVGTAANVAAMPLNLAMTVGGGIAHEAGAIWDGLGNRDTLAGGAVGAIGDAASSVGSAIMSFLSDGSLKRNVAPIANALALVSSL